MLTGYPEAHPGKLQTATDTWGHVGTGGRTTLSVHAGRRQQCSSSPSSAHLGAEGGPGGAVLSKLAAGLWTAATQTRERVVQKAV